MLRRLVASTPDDLSGPCDCALILVGFAGALRRVELAASTHADLEPTERGLWLTLAHGKGGHADIVAVPPPYGQTELCPVRALERWLTATGITPRGERVASRCGTPVTLMLLISQGYTRHQAA